MQLTGNKRSRSDMSMSIDDQYQNKKSRIVNQMMEGVYQYNKKNTSVNILDVNMVVRVKDYDVRIYKSHEGTKYICSCTNDVYKNCQSNYCKHISMAIKELVKDYICENEKFFKHKQQEELFRENIEFLKSSFKDIKICNIYYDKNPFSKK